MSDLFKSSKFVIQFFENVRSNYSAEGSLSSGQADISESPWPSRLRLILQARPTLRRQCAASLHKIAGEFSRAVEGSSMRLQSSGSWRCPRVRPTPGQDFVDRHTWLKLVDHVPPGEGMPLQPEARDGRPFLGRWLHRASQADTAASVYRQLAQSLNPRGRCSDKSAGAALPIRTHCQALRRGMGQRPSLTC